MFNMIDGKQISASVKQRVLTETEKLRQNNITATLAVVIVGNNPAKSAALFRGNMRWMRTLPKKSC